MEQYSTIMASLQDLEAAQSDERFDLKMVGHENPVGACYRDGSGTHQRGRGICQLSWRSILVSLTCEPRAKTGARFRRFSQR